MVKSESSYASFIPQFGFSRARGVIPVRGVFMSTGLEISMLSKYSDAELAGDDFAGTGFELRRDDAVVFDFEGCFRGRIGVAKCPPDRHNFRVSVARKSRREMCFGLIDYPEQSDFQ